jgi:hypothetical protein
MPVPAVGYDEDGQPIPLPPDWQQPPDDAAQPATAAPAAGAGGLSNDVINAAIQKIMADRPVQLPSRTQAPDDGTKPGWLGLLGEALSGGQSPLNRLSGQQEDAAGSRALLNFGINMMLASGPHAVKTPLFSAVAEGLQGAQQSMDSSQRAAFTQAGQQFAQQKDLADLQIAQQDARVKQLQAVLPLLRLQGGIGALGGNPPPTLGGTPPAPLAPGVPGAPGSSLPSDPEAALQVLAHRESGNRNVPNQQGPGGTPASSASGYFQMIDPTWREGAKLAGVDISQYPRAMNAPYEVQHTIARALYDKYGATPWAASEPQGPPGGGVAARTPGAVNTAGPGAPPAGPTAAPGGQLPLPPVPPPGGPPPAAVAPPPGQIWSPSNQVGTDTLPPPRPSLPPSPPPGASAAPPPAPEAPPPQIDHTAPPALRPPGSPPPAPQPVALPPDIAARTDQNPTPLEQARLTLAAQTRDRAVALATSTGDLPGAAAAQKQYVADVNAIQTDITNRVKDGNKSADDYRTQQAERSKIAFTTDEGQRGAQMTNAAKQIDETQTALDHLHMVQQLSTSAGPGGNVLNLPGMQSTRDWLISHGAISPDNVGQYTAASTLEAANNRLITDLRAGSGFIRTTDADLKFLDRSSVGTGFTPLQLRNGRAAFLETALQHQIKYNNALYDNLSSGMKYTDAKAAADKSIPPILQSVPSALHNQTDIDRWVWDNHSPGTFYKGQDGNLRIFDPPKGAVRP